MAAGAFSVTPPDVEPLEPIWCGAFDNQGVLQGVWRGNRAFSVVWRGNRAFSVVS
jgi:hypothetical protein